MKARNNSNYKCSECGVELVRNSVEFICPKCGLVEEIIEGS